MSEFWRPVLGFETYYEVSDHGSVRSWHYRRPTLLSPTYHEGHFRVALFVDGRATHRYVHQLVAEAFIGPCPKGLEVCHNDGDGFNNQVENLRYGTKSSNRFDMVTHGVHPNARMTQCRQGHPFDAENTYRYAGKNKRACRACRAEWARQARARKQERQFQLLREDAS